MPLPDLNRQPLTHVDATPDGNYALRILQAFRDNCGCKWVSNTDNPLVSAMNKLQEERAKELDIAINLLIKRKEE